MTDEMRWNKNLSYREACIAYLEELDIENQTLQIGAPQDALDLKALAAKKAALREIDRLKVSGEYGRERKRLAALDDKPHALREQPKDLPDLRPVENFVRGCNSPDPEQRARFQALKKEIGGKSPAEVWYILACLEPAQRPKGRPGASPPWRHVAAQMEAMRLAVAEGVLPLEAARNEAAKDRRADTENRARYLERLYRQKMALRE